MGEKGFDSTYTRTHSTYTPHATHATPLDFRLNFHGNNLDFRVAQGYSVVITW